MTAIVIDDEYLSRQVISNMVTSYKSRIEIIGEADSVSSGIELVESKKPDLVFLDIEMKDGTGFDVLKKINYKNFNIIFTTAHDNYAIQAFQYSAINYLLKPISRHDLYFAITQAAEKISLTEHTKQRQVNALIDNVQNSSFNKKLVLPDKDGYLIKPLNEIIRLEGYGNYSKVIFLDKSEFISSYSLSYYENFLTENGFFRIFKSHLINLSYVVRYQNTDGGTVIMADNSQLRISSLKKEAFKSLFN